MSAPHLPSAFIKAADQGDIAVQIHMAGVFVKQMAVPRAGMYVPQHSHAYDHLTMLAVGSVRVWVEGAVVGEFTAPAGILIAAHKKHLFETLEDECLLYCIHPLDQDAAEPRIEQEHHVAMEA